MFRFSDNKLVPPNARSIPELIKNEKQKIEARKQKISSIQRKRNSNQRKSQQRQVQSPRIDRRNPYFTNRQPTKQTQRMNISRDKRDSFHRHQNSRNEEKERENERVLLVEKQKLNHQIINALVKSIESEREANKILFDQLRSKQAFLKELLKSKSLI